jgi:hypothetical protein
MVQVLTGPVLLVVLVVPAVVPVVLILQVVVLLPPVKDMLGEILLVIQEPVVVALVQPVVRESQELEDLAALVIHQLSQVLRLRMLVVEEVLLVPQELEALEVVVTELQM